jgi:hypothetical protein
MIIIEIIIIIIYLYSTLLIFYIHLLNFPFQVISFQCF